MTTRLPLKLLGPMPSLLPPTLLLEPMTTTTTMPPSTSRTRMRPERSEARRSTLRSYPPL